MRDDVSLLRRAKEAFVAWRARSFPEHDKEQVRSVNARWVVPVTLWIGVSTVVTAANVLLTERLGVGALALYWFGLIGLAIGSATALARWGQTWSAKGRGLAWLAFGVVWTAGLTGLNAAINPDQRTVSLALDMAIIVGALTGTFLTVRSSLTAQMSETSTSSHQDPEQAFLVHVTVDLRAPLLRIEAQDHYLNVVTEKGVATILMRFADALALLEACDGEQVHRSHWVARRAIVTIEPVGRRDFIVVADGTRVPVSRSHRARLRENGFLVAG